MAADLDDSDEEDHDDGVRYVVAVQMKVKVTLTYMYVLYRVELSVDCSDAAYQPGVDMQV